MHEIQAIRLPYLGHVIKIDQSASCIFEFSPDYRILVLWSRFGLRDINTATWLVEFFHSKKKCCYMKAFLPFSLIPLPILFLCIPSIHLRPPFLLVFTFHACLPFIFTHLPSCLPSMFKLPFCSPAFIPCLPCLPLCHSACLVHIHKYQLDKFFPCRCRLTRTGNLSICYLTHNQLC